MSPIERSATRLFTIAICIFCLALFGNVTPKATMQDENKEAQQTIQAQGGDQGKFDKIEDGRMMIHSLDKEFARAATKFHVPVEILKAVGYEASRWNQGETDTEKNEAIGVMGLKARF